MRVRDLIDQLKSMNPDAEVRLAIQPSWPFEHSLSRELIEIAETECEGCDGSGRGYEGDSCHSCNGTGKTEAEPIVYLAEGNQIGYLPGLVSRGLGWR